MESIAVKAPDFDDTKRGHATPLPESELELLEFSFQIFKRLNLVAALNSSPESSSGSAIESLQSIMWTEMARNDSNEVKILIHKNETRYVFPPHSCFFLGDFSRFHSAILSLAQQQPFDLIVIDPPWRNSSAKRSGVYRELPYWNLTSLPLFHFYHSGQSRTTWVAIWVTNDPELRLFIFERLLPAWKLKAYGIWYWIKVSSQGLILNSFRSSRHKPYEQLIIAQSHDANESEKLERVQTFISIPAVHSRKPRIDQLFSRVLPTESCMKLELFARQVSPGWICCGNQVLMFNQLEHFKIQGLP